MSWSTDIELIDASGSLSKQEMDQFIAARERLIREKGMMVMTIAPFGMCTNYSIGMHDQDLPELIALGLPPDVGHELLHDIGAMLSEIRAKNPSGDLVGGVQPKGWHRQFVLIPVERPMGSSVAVGAAQRSKNKASYLQVVHADRNGFFPWDHRCSATFRSHQPILAQVH